MTEPRGWRTFAVTALGACAAVLLVGHVASEAFATLVGVLAALAIGGFALQASRHARLTQALRSCSAPAEVHGMPARLGILANTAFVAGLRRPEIYCDHRLIDRLTPQELLAVALHEHAHQLAHDPLRLTVVAAVAPVAAHLPGGRSWIERFVARREIAADRYAMDKGASKAGLASALLRLLPAEAPHVACFARAAELRLRVLLGETAPAPGLHRGWIVGGALSGLALCVALVHPAVESVAPVLAALTWG